MNVYLEIGSAHAQFNKNAKIATVIVSFFPLAFLANSMIYILNG